MEPFFEWDAEGEHTLKALPQVMNWFGRAKVAVAPITEFGLLEMTRQRIRVSLLDSMSDECPSCKGSGRIMSQETLITRLDHWLRRYKSKYRSIRLKLQLHPHNATYLKGEKKHVLRGLMWQNFVHLKYLERRIYLKTVKLDFCTYIDKKLN